MTDYYVDGAVGDDANAGTSEGAGNAWATINKACQTMVGGDRTYVKASVTYDELATFLVNGSNRTTGMIQLIGYQTTPGDDGIVSHTATAANNCLAVPAGTNNYLRIHNFDFYGSLVRPVTVSGTNEFYNCRFRNSPNEGASVGGGCQFFNCLFQGNALEGVATGNDATFVGCVFNGALTIDSWVSNNSNPRFYRCLFMNNGYSGGSNQYCISQMEMAIGCTFDGRNPVGGGRRCDDLTLSITTDRMFCDNLIVGMDSRVIGNGSASAGFSFGGFGNYIGDQGNTTPADGLYCTASEGAGVDILGLKPSEVIGTLIEADVDAIFAERYVDYVPALGSVLVGSGVTPPDSV